MTPTEATNRITEFVRQRTAPNWWAMHGGFFVGLVAETIAAVVSGVISEVVDERLEFLEHAADTTTKSDITQPIRIPLSAEQMNAGHVTVKAEDEGES